ncbi:hypothetical protein QYM36_003988, partial [Artemia franciscana]
KLTMKIWTGLVIFTLAGDIMMMAYVSIQSKFNPHNWYIPRDWWNIVDKRTVLNLNVAKPFVENPETEWSTGVVEVPDKYSLWRSDRKCGYDDSGTLYLLSDNMTVAQCDPDGWCPCCSRAGLCDVDYNLYCDCPKCIDYREISERRKSQFVKLRFEANLKKLEEDSALADEVSKEKKAMEEKVSDLSQALAEEEEKSKHLAELKEKHETSLSDLEERLNKEQIAGQESKEEFEALKATTAAEQELRTKREQELALLKKSLEEESGHHESQLMEMRHKHSQELEVLHEQMDNAKKIKEVLEKAKATLEAENADMANEIKSIATSKAETDRKRKHLESQVSELTSRLQESEGARSEVQDRLVRIQTDMESLVAQLVDAESRSVNATKSNANTEQQLNEMQTQLEVETKQKLALNAQIRQLEIEKEGLHNQVEDAEGANTVVNTVFIVIELEKTQRNFDKILAEEKAISERFASERDAAERDARKKETKVLSLSRDLEEYIVKVEELERSRRVLQNELDELANSQGTADKNVEETGSGDKTQTIAENYEDERFDVHIPDSDTTMSNGAGHFVQPPTFGARNNALRILIHELLRGDPDALRTHTPNGAGHFVQPPSFGARNNALRIVIQELLRGDPDALR